MGEESTRAPQMEMARPAPVVAPRVRSVPVRRSPAERPLARRVGLSGSAATQLVEKVTTGLSDKVHRSVDGAVAILGPTGRVRANAGAAASPVQVNPAARRIIRRNYVSLGEQNPDYAEPKFTGKAPKQESIPELLQSKRFQASGLEVLYQQAAAVAPEFKKKVNALAAATGGKPQYRSSKADEAAMAGMSEADQNAKREKDNLDLSKPLDLKTKARAAQKANSDYGGKASGLADILGGTIEYDSFPNMVAGFKQCGTLGLEIVREKNRFVKPTAGGYRDILLNVKLSNGHIAELQFNLTAMLKAKSKGHKQYEEVRTIEGAHKESNLPLDAEELAKVKRLYDEMRAIYQEAAAAAGIPTDQAELTAMFGP